MAIIALLAFSFISGCIGDINKPTINIDQNVTRGSTDNRDTTEETTINKTTNVNKTTIVYD